MNIPDGRRALLVGATGMVGSKLLSRLVEHQAFGAVTTLGRRAPDLNHESVTHHVTDFSDSPRPMPTADVLFCCLGTTIKRAGSQKAFRAIDYELVVSIANQAVENGTTSFFVVSSVGANPDSGNFYLKTKGEMEQTVAVLGFKRTGIVRPSLLLGTRQEVRPAEQLGQYAARLINPVLPDWLARYRAVDAGTVANAMIGLDQSDFEGPRIVEGSEIQRLAGLWR